MTRALFTTSEITRLYGVPPSTLNRWAREGRLIRYGTPGHALYDATEIDQLVQQLGRRLDEFDQVSATCDTH